MRCSTRGDPLLGDAAPARRDRTAAPASDPRAVAEDPATSCQPRRARIAIRRSLVVHGLDDPAAIPARGPTVAGRGRDRTSCSTTPGRSTQPLYARAEREAVVDRGIASAARRAQRCAPRLAAAASSLPARRLAPRPHDRVPALAATPRESRARSCSRSRSRPGEVADVTRRRFGPADAIRAHTLREAVGMELHRQPDALRRADPSGCGCGSRDASIALAVPDRTEPPQRSSITAFEMIGALRSTLFASSRICLPSLPVRDLVGLARERRRRAKRAW